MSATIDNAKIVKNIDAIADNVIALVALGAEHLLPKNVVTCVREVENANKYVNESRMILCATCKDPG